MPLQFISMPLPSQCISELFVASATHINSTQCLRYAILGFAKPLRLNTNLCNTLAIQLISIHHLCYAKHRQAIADRNRSSRFSTVPLRIDATLCRSVHRHCGSKRLSSNLRLRFHIIAGRGFACLCRCSAFLFFAFADQIVSMLRHCDSMLVSAFALRHFAVLCLCSSIPRMHIFAIAKRFLTSLYPSYAFYLLAMPLPRYSIFTSQYRCNSTRFRAMPSPDLTIRRPAMPWPFFAPPRTALP